VYDEVLISIVSIEAADRKEIDGVVEDVGVIL
jgi:hypothetical protein